MGYSVVKINGMPTSTQLVEYIVDSESDISSLPVLVADGSTAYTKDLSKTYLFKSGLWTEVEDGPSDAQVEQAVSDWLEAHPEATTTVQDGAITYAKLDNALKENIDGKANKADTILDTTLSRGRKTNSIIGTGSFAFGYDVEASGNYSHAEGSGTVASGPISHAEGVTTKAVGNTSHAEGATTIASGNTSHAEGDTTIASGDYSHTEGLQTAASGDYSHAEGAGTAASGNFSHSEGNSTIASGANSHAEGVGTTASGTASHAEGESTVASGNDSHAEGAGTTASGKYSHAEGAGATASGNCSHSEGNYTTASGAFQHVFGMYNANDPEASPSNPNTKGKYIEIVGNGTANNALSNARTLDWSGNEALAGSITLGMGTADEVALSAAQLKQLLALLN